MCWGGGGLGQFADLKGGLAQKRGGCFCFWGESVIKISADASMQVALGGEDVCNNICIEGATSFDKMEHHINAKELLPAKLPAKLLPC